MVVVEDDELAGCVLGGSVVVAEDAAGTVGFVVDPIVVEVLARVEDWPSEHPTAAKAMLRLAAVSTAVRRMA
jgi:hypothetical protein